MKELLECKHPTAWIEFEKGMIDEVWLELVNGIDKYVSLLPKISICTVITFHYHIN
jgi:hypothetical protein